MREAAGLWRLFLTVPNEAAAEAVAAVFGSEASAVSAFETTPEGEWRVEGFADHPPDRAAIEAMLEVAALGHASAFAGTDPFTGLVIERVPDQDWLAINQASFPPLRIGRYFIYGSHHKGGVPAGAIGLRIDAAAAFGTGEHATTRGCLLALDHLARYRSARGRRFLKVLDMGTGTAILAMAASRSWAVPVLACDIDAGSLRVAGLNLRVNGRRGRVRLFHSDGYTNRLIRREAPFDLVTANILARPLMQMAADLAAVLAENGIVVLSGLLVRQVPAVLSAHRAAGLTLRRRIMIDGWATLILARGSVRP
jgi:ribosomal protein L11 methyltransferase